METKISNLQRLSEITGTVYVPVIQLNSDGNYENCIISADKIVDKYNNLSKDDYYTKTEIDKKENKFKIITVYKKSTSTPIIYGGSYDFTLDYFTAPEGWSKDYTILEDPIWASTKIFCSNGNSTDWSAPMKFSKSESSTSVPKSVIKIIFKQSLSLPEAPIGGSYSFSSKKFSIPAGWVETTSDLTNIIWFSYNTYYSDGTSSSWSTPVRMMDLDNIITLINNKVNIAISDLNLTLTTKINNVSVDVLDSTKSYISSSISSIDLSAKVSSIQSTVNTLLNTVSSLMSYINNSLKKDLSNLNTLVQLLSLSKASTTAVNNLVSKMESYLTKVNNLLTIVNTYQTSMDSKIEQLTNLYNVLYEKVAQLSK